MTILTIEEAAQFLRVTKRTLYRLKDIPRIRIGHSLRFVKEDLEVWVREQQEGATVHRKEPAETLRTNVDEETRTPYHRNPVFRLPAFRSA